jgi:hypothetical protein
MWLDAIAQARRLVSELPPEDAGCLYWNPVTKNFETPVGEIGRYVRHFGSRGGVLPSIGDDPLLGDDDAERRLLVEKVTPVIPPQHPKQKAKAPLPRDKK